MVDKEVRELGGSVSVAGRVHGRQEVVVDVVVASDDHDGDGSIEVLGQSRSRQQRPQLIEGVLKVQNLLAQAVPLSLHFACEKKQIQSNEVHPMKMEEFFSCIYDEDGSISPRHIPKSFVFLSELE